MKFINEFEKASANTEVIYRKSDNNDVIDAEYSVEADTASSSACNRHTNPQQYTSNINSNLPTASYPMPQEYTQTMNFPAQNLGYGYSDSSNDVQAKLEANIRCQVEKQYDVNCKQFEKLGIIQQIRQNLFLYHSPHVIGHEIPYYRTPKNLQNLYVRTPSFMLDAVYRICETTSLELDGVMLACCQIINLATCGAVKLRISNNELIPLSILTVQEVQNQTDAIKAIQVLCDPIDTFIKIKQEELTVLPDVEKTSKLVVKEVEKQLKKDLQSMMTEMQDFSSENLESLRIQIEDKQKALTAFQEQYTTQTRMLLTHAESLVDFRRDCFLSKGRLAYIGSNADFIKNQILKKNRNNKQIIQSEFLQESATVRIRNKSMTVKNPSFSIACLTASNILSDIYTNEELKANGFGSTVIPYLHTNPFAYRGRDCDVSGYDFSKFITRLLDLYFSLDHDKQEAFIVDLDEEAMQLHEDFILQVNSSSIFLCDESIQAIKHLPVLAIKLAWSYHVSLYEVPHEHRINADAIRFGIALSSCLYPQVLYATDPTMLQAYSDAKAIHTNLCQIDTELDSDTLGHGYITSRMLNKRVGIYGKKFDNAITFLQRHGVVYMLDNGDKSNDIILHPHYKQFTFI